VNDASRSPKVNIASPAQSDVAPESLARTSSTPTSSRAADMDVSAAATGTATLAPLPAASSPVATPPATASAPVVTAPAAAPTAPPPTAPNAAASSGAAGAVPADSAPRSGLKWKDGTFSGWGTSRHGDIEATVIIEKGRITAAAISRCLTRYSCSWVAHLQPQVVERQSPEVDNVSGATESANAFYYAVVEALKAAKP
jgi:uncharacterized protein with FMN-binding domain